MGGREGRIMQEGRVRSIRGPYIIHSGKSISGEYSGVRCEHQPPPAPPQGSVMPRD